jgi:asparagine synthase (glutamine-hydrolysing)
MCGIVAAFAYGDNAAPLAEDEILRIRDRMIRRGPDAAGLWMAEDRRVALAHRRLSIIDLNPRGNQPMLVAETGTRITFNGEIYNYRELRRELEDRGHVFRTSSDTEVLLHAYDAYGAAMVDRLRGMYAFAIWDPRRYGLFLARDPFGIKPLYYVDDGLKVTVASQAKALLACDEVKRETSEAGKVSFLLWGFVVEPFTLYRDIHALPAGSTMWIDGRGRQAATRFWDVSSAFRRAEELRAEMPQRAFGPSTARERLQEAMVDSIRHHMISDVPVGMFLSAGLDSATLVALAAEHGIGDLRTLTLGFDRLRGGPYDEVVGAEQIAATYHTAHDSRWIGSEQFALCSADLLAQMDQPSIDGANVYFISKVAAAAGLKVALSGLGGDELFGGYPSFRQIPKIVRTLRPFAALPKFGTLFRYLSAPLLRRYTSPKYASLLEYGTTVEDAYLLRRALFLPWELPDILDPEEVRLGWNALAMRDRLRECIEGLKSAHSKVAALEMSIYMRNQLLRDSDWAGMAHSLEIRVPFVDTTLFERVAPFLVSPTLLTKRDLVATLDTKLPAAITDRPKTGFAVPIRDWLFEAEGAPPRVPGRGLRGWARYILDAHCRGQGI